jgi:hypothetical protein
VLDLHVLLWPEICLSLDRLRQMMAAIRFGKAIAELDRLSSREMAHCCSSKYKLSQSKPSRFRFPSAPQPEITQDESRSLHYQPDLRCENLVEKSTRLLFTHGLAHEFVSHVFLLRIGDVRNICYYIDH